MPTEHIHHTPSNRPIDQYYGKLWTAEVDRRAQYEKIAETLRVAAITTKLLVGGYAPNDNSIDYLTRVWQSCTRPNEMPSAFYVGLRLYWAYENQMISNTRYTSHALDGHRPYLMFKGCKVILTSLCGVLGDYGLAVHYGALHAIP